MNSAWSLLKIATLSRNKSPQSNRNRRLVSFPLCSDWLGAAPPENSTSPEDGYSRYHYGYHCSVSTVIVHGLLLCCSGSGLLLWSLNEELTVRYSCKQPCQYPFQTIFYFKNYKDLFLQNIWQDGLDLKKGGKKMNWLRTLGTYTVIQYMVHGTVHGMIHKFTSFVPLSSTNNAVALPWACHAFQISNGFLTITILHVILKHNTGGKQSAYVMQCEQKSGKNW